MMSQSYNHLYSVRKYFVINNGDGLERDSDLTPIVFSLPEPPTRWDKIKNYGLHPDDQVYVMDDMPKRLKALEEQVVVDANDAFEASRNKTVNGYKLLKAFWLKLTEEAEHYQKEIQWMRNVIWKRYHGEWVFIDGELMWFPPRYYMYVNFWHIAVPSGYERPEFRIRDWKSACGNHYTRTTREGFRSINNKGIAIKDEAGEFDIDDFGIRVFYGNIRPKNRRSGATNEGLNEAHETVCTGTGKKATTLSKSVPDVEEFFNEMLFPSWRRIPMFLKPVWQGATAGGKSIEYKPPSNMYGAQSMESVMYYVNTTDEVVLDSKRLDFVLLDEQGKKTGGGRVDVSERWDVSKQTLSTGNGASIHGFALNPSTAEEMEDGAKAYKLMCDQSGFYQRSKTGQTMSGLMLMYFPAQYCLEGFVDCFGGAVVGTPTERQIELTRKHFPKKANVFINYNMGASEYLKADRNKYLASGTPDDMKKYRGLMRKHPMRYAESWIGDSGDIGFPIVKIDARLTEEASSGGKWMIPGSFKWAHGRDSKVLWDAHEDGRFELSMHLTKEFTNRKKRVRVYNGIAQKWEWQLGPIDPRFVLGNDTFGFDNKSIAQLREGKTRKSDGGIAVYYPFDPRVDKEDSEEEWKSDRFVLSYRYRPPSLEEYNEDVLMACVWFGAWCYPERNATSTWEYFIKRGYGGYLKYDINPSTGKVEERPGYWVGAGSKDKMFNALSDYLDKNAHRERHASFLRECKDIRGPEYLNNFDRLAAHGAAKMGAMDMYIQSVQSTDKNLIEEAYNVVRGF